MRLIGSRVVGLLVGSSLLLTIPAAVAGAPRARQAEALPGRYIVQLERGMGAARQGVARLSSERGLRPERVFARFDSFAAQLTAQQVAALRADPRVVAVVADHRVRAADTTVASGDSAPTGTRRIEAATTTATQDASDVRVAVLDTGIDLDHPDLNVAHGTNCITPGAPADDDNGHGTHVAGTIAARNNGSGVIGVAPGTRVVAVKVLDDAGDGSWTSIICGIDWVLSTRTDSDPANDIAVVNMSLGGIGPAVQPCATTSDAMHRAICAAHAAGVTFVVAAGNRGWDFDYAPSPDVPAAYPEVLTVTSMTDSDGRPGGTGGAPACATNQADDRFASYSNYATSSAAAAHTVAAPGTCITSTWPGGGYQTISGTSMATPHVAGLVALCLSEAGVAGPCAGLAPTQVVQRIRDDAQAHRVANPGYGFSGDPARPVSGRYYGDLVRVGVTEPTPAPAPITITPFAAVVVNGSLHSGTYARLATDDNRYYEVASTKRSTYTTAWYGRFSAVPRELSALSVTYSGHNSRSCSQTVALWDWSSSTWVTLDTRSVGTAEVKVERAATGSLSGFVSSSTADSGEVRVRVRCTSTSATFRARADQLTLTYTGS